MSANYEYTVTERFLRYVQTDTQSDPQSETHPTTEKQKDLSRILVDELKAIGLQEAYMDEWGYVFATIPATTDKKVPVICFCSHVDTAPDCSGTNVRPLLHVNYDGKDIVLPDDNTQIISSSKYPYLREHIGGEIITASGLTLLGADDKSGVAIIMDAANYLITHPEIKHGEIKILFTPDEEVGKGTAKLDVQKLGADFGYTLDGGEMGTLEDETFSADAAVIDIFGVISHPGYAKKGGMVNALKIAGEILNALPKDRLSPESTEGKEGFVHPVRVSGLAEKATIEFIVRDFTTSNLVKHEKELENLAKQVVAKHSNLVKHEKELKNLAEQVVAKHKGARIEFTVQEQYRNMKEVLDKHPQVVAYAEEAYKRNGLKPVKEPIRGGTDGSKLSFMGLPCPNIFTGMQAIHSRHEWIGVRDMKKAVDVLVTLVQVWEEKS
jgi:tripeptide aminopeptidase